MIVDKFYIYVNVKLKRKSQINQSNWKINKKFEIVTLICFYTCCDCEIQLLDYEKSKKKSLFDNNVNNSMEKYISKEKQNFNQVIIITNIKKKNFDNKLEKTFQSSMQ